MQKKIKTTSSMKIKVIVSGEAKAITKPMEVTEKEYKLLKKIEKDINSLYQEAYSPSMYVEEVEEN